MEKGRLTQRRSINSNARVIKAITECGPLLLASVGNSPKLERMDFSPVLSAMIMAFLYNQTTAPFFKIITQKLFLFYIAFCCGFSTAFGCLPRLAPQQMHHAAQTLEFRHITDLYDALMFETLHSAAGQRDQTRRHWVGCVEPFGA